MSELIVVAYAERDQATQVIEGLCQVETGWIELSDVIIVIRDKKGRLRVPDHPGPRGRVVAWGALWRRLLQPPVLTGDPRSDSREHHAGVAGIPEGFLRATSDLLARSDSALIILARMKLPAFVDERLSASSANVLRLPLSHTQDALLSSVLDVQGPGRSETVTHLS